MIVDRGRSLYLNIWDVEGIDYCVRQDLLVVDVIDIENGVVPPIAYGGGGRAGFGCLVTGAVSL